MRNRFNACSETAVTKAAAIIYPGVQLSYGHPNNDAQCDLAPLLVKIPGQDQAIFNPGLGGQCEAVTNAHSRAMERIKRETGLTDLRGEPESLEARETRLAGDDFERIIAIQERADILAERTKFTQYVQRELAPIMEPINRILATELHKLTPPNVYMLRTGAEGGSGHFHTVYYEAPNWMLDSGLKEGQPNIGILYNTQTQQLGRMAGQVIDPSHEWGQGQGKKRLDFFEMNPTRTMVAAKYIEKYRALEPEDTELVFPEEFINEIIAEPNYLSTFGSGNYWQAQQNGRRFSPPAVSAEQYIRTAYEQCTQQGLPGAITQLRHQGYFRNPEQGTQLLATLLANNKIDAVTEILRQNLVDLTHPVRCAALYQSALYFSQTHPDYPPGLIPSLRALQNKLIETLAPEDLPFTIQDTCEALNLDALERMLTLEEDIPHAELIAQVNKSARECRSSPSTFQPILEALREHERTARNTDAEEANHEQIFDAPFDDDEEEEEIEQLIDTESFEEMLIALNQDDDLSPQDAWGFACDALENKEPYSCAEANRGKDEYRAIEYHAETTDGDTIINIVSESEQILLDELYAKKLEADEHFGLGR
ncbi:MAG: hypothetical protein KBB94_05390 [Legionellaceae bacterium]|nr:hypothetical protein [Legionellaceae bacterium]MBP9775169.1 hypothetical protein [Legionellaceae bacterium]